MSTGTPTDAVCENQTAALIASPLGVRGSTAPVDPVSRSFPHGDPQYSAPGAPPSR